ncbi:SAV_915 family protein [Cellulomonas bogoriensis]|uniref:SseB protein N-terminal domain-containing protein n=1 Tax=Cellulomonas bogoriensis 69B4 = DSM 16987 TaxID=1386082 RepID=A0A0A0BZG5_9CELL|nr:SAV_915 family protein [Cellulomonas bogoriensis]KGM13330.1 hypothetical protein N869_14825 [Cellulomonas bogoriensis 69B4 = DSM 16987]
MDDEHTMPPFVYLLRPDDAAPDENLVVKHRLADGRTALLAYTALDRVGRLCGPHQPWILARTEELAAFAPYDVLVIDQPTTPTASAQSQDVTPAGRPTVPPVVYLPVRPGERSGTPEVRTLKDGRLALLAYTALDRLGTSCGERQPWVAVETPRLDEVKRRNHYDVVVFDMVVPEQYRREGRIA